MLEVGTPSLAGEMGECFLRSRLGLCPQLDGLLQKPLLQLSVLQLAWVGANKGPGRMTGGRTCTLTVWTLAVRSLRRVSSGRHKVVRELLVEKWD